MPCQTRRSPRRLRFFLAATLLCLAAAPALAQQPGPTPSQLANLDIEQLARIRVTSAGRKAEPLADATAAITVITAEDIRRMGATSVPEALRMVPGLDVARVGARDWAISARGFNEQSSNKLLVLVDGRTTYSPVFSGVNWDALVVPLGEIDRIEVIRGPGGTLWGANAVNGVINIITRSADESQGGRVALAAGTWDKLAGSIRYGGELGSRTSYRVYAGGRMRDPAVLFDGTEAQDDWNFGQGGFRMDGRPSSRDHWTLQGDVYSGNGGNRLILPTDSAPVFATVRDADLNANGGNVLGRWVRQFGTNSNLMVRGYYDRSHREVAPYFGTMNEELLDFEAQYRVPLFHRHDVIWGAGYRRIHDDVTGTPAVRFNPDSRSTDLFTGFVQDEITLAPGRFTLTLGSKLEHNDFTGFEVEPNLRLLWTPSSTQSVWAAVSRAVRTPARVDADADAVSAIPNLRFKAVLVGSDSFASEELIAYEAGYRTVLSSRLSLDVSAFYNDYDELRTLTPIGVLPGSPRPVVPFVLQNRASGHTGGVELSATWQAARRIRIRGSYSYLDANLMLDPGTPAGTIIGAAFNTPHHQATLWSSIDLPHDLQLDLIGRYVGRLPGPNIPEYAEADARLGWDAGNGFQFSLVGQDLLQAHHREFPTSSFTLDNRAIERRGYAKVTWSF
ncbi:MAG TPA: TonB-dependent receptor [Gemmatimonadales bacterium]|nr:TonB-dependent receptor [Gemmatimonadales bacterium]